MHTFGNHNFGNNWRRKLIFHNPFGENLVHISTLLSVLLASFCDDGKTIGILIEVLIFYIPYFNALATPTTM